MLNSQFINILIGKQKVGEATYNQVGADHTGLQIGQGTESFRFETNDANCAFFDTVSGSDITGTGTRANPYQTWATAKTLVGTGTITTICQLDNGTISDSPLDTQTQADLGKTPDWNGSTLTSGLAGYKISNTSVTIQPASPIGGVVNCTFDAGANQAVSLFDIGANVEKCLMKLCQFKWENRVGTGDKLLDCEFAENTNCFLEMQNLSTVSTVILENCIISKLRSAAGATVIELQATECTFTNTTERVLDFDNITTK